LFLGEVTSKESPREPLGSGRLKWSISRM
jgi:hypothetical protein